MDRYSATHRVRTIAINCFFFVDRDVAFDVIDKKSCWTRMTCFHASRSDKKTNITSAPYEWCHLLFEISNTEDPWLENRRSNFLSENNVNLETVNDIQSCPTNEFKHIRAEPSRHKQQLRVHECFSNPRQNQKSSLPTILWNLTKLVKSHPGIMVHLRLTVLKQMIFLKNTYCSNPDWEENVLLQL